MTEKIKKLLYDRRIKYILRGLVLVLLVIGISGMSYTVSQADFGDTYDYSADDGNYNADYGYDYDNGYDADGEGLISDLWFFVAVIYQTFGLPGLVVAVLLLFVAYKAWIRWKQTATASGTFEEPLSYDHSYTPVFADCSDEIEQQIKQKDALFDMGDLFTYVKNTFVTIQYSWMNQDVESLRPILHPNFLEQTQKQIQAKIQSRTKNVLERVAVTDIYATEYRERGQLAYIDFVIQAQMIDYQQDIDTGMIKAGNPTRLVKNRYLLTMCRSVGTKTPEEKDGAVNCPNCGAPLTAVAYGKCEYCGSLVTSGKYGWVISDLKHASEQ